MKKLFYRILALLRGRLWCFGSVGGRTEIVRRIDKSVLTKEVQWDEMGRTTLIRKSRGSEPILRSMNEGMK